MKSKLKSIVVTKQEQVILENIESITISNQNNVATTFTLNGIKRILPPINEVFNVPVAPFVITSNNYAFDLDLEFTEANTNIVIDYIQLPKNHC